MRFYHEQANLPDGAARLVDPATAAACRMRLVNQLRSLRYDDACTDPRRREIWLLATRALFGLTGLGRGQGSQTAASTSRVPSWFNRSKSMGKTPYKLSSEA